MNLIEQLKQTPKWSEFEKLMTLLNGKLETD